MGRYKDLQGMPLQANEGSPFMGRVVDVERSEGGIFVRIPFDMLDSAGISTGTNKVEVWREMDGTVSFRIATICPLCRSGARLYELDMGFSKINSCAEHYFELVGKYPEGATSEETTL